MLGREGSGTAAQPVHRAMGLQESQGTKCGVLCCGAVLCGGVLLCNGAVPFPMPLC